MNVQSKHPTERGIREKNGKWEYRFTLNGQPYSRVTDLEAVPENILKVHAERTAHIEELKKGKPVIRRVITSLDHAIPKFMAWYRSEHQNRKCKWAASLMASFQFYFEQTKCPLTRIGPAQLEDFKTWRRENAIHDNTLRKQLLLLRQFFRYARKQGWTKGDPFAQGEDAEVKIPREQDSDAMRVLSPDEEVRYLTAAARESIDLADVATIMLRQGPRPDEVMSLEQSQVDLRNRHFTIWDNNAQGKSRNAHRKLKMTDETFRIFQRRLSVPGVWVFPSSKNEGPRTTLQKAHRRATRGKKTRDGKYEGGCGIECRLYDMRHTFATRFALAGGSLPVLARILGHADLSLLMRYVHPSQADMDRAMEWYSNMQTRGTELEKMLLEYHDGTNQAETWPRPTSGPSAPPKLAQIGPTRPKLANRRIS
ncbi:MAG: tyrosine-type recombinase/integrase [Bryobacteraceae bacterium]